MHVFSCIYTSLRMTDELNVDAFVIFYRQILILFGIFIVGDLKMTPASMSNKVKQHAVYFCV